MVQKRKLERKCIDYESNVYKPIGIPMKDLKIQNLTKEEVTAIYYADYIGLKQNESAEKMGISQPSFSRELNMAHTKIACAFFHGFAIQFGSGPSENSDEKENEVK
ncbi:MAG: DUF134 domain-containing protein [Candidatus Thorarchaeota archaeon]